MLYISRAFNLSSNIHSGSLFELDICLTTVSFIQGIALIEYFTLSSLKFQESEIFKFFGFDIF